MKQSKAQISMVGPSNGLDVHELLDLSQMRVSSQTYSPLRQCRIVCAVRSMVPRLARCVNPSKCAVQPKITKVQPRTPHIHLQRKR